MAERCLLSRLKPLNWGWDHPVRNRDPEKSSQGKHKKDQIKVNSVSKKVKNSGHNVRNHSKIKKYYVKSE